MKLTAYCIVDDAFHKDVTKTTTTRKKLTKKTTKDVEWTKSTTETATAARSSRPSNSATGGDGATANADDANESAAPKIRPNCGKVVRRSEKLVPAVRSRNGKPTDRN